MRPRRRRPPFWFELLVAVCLALAWRALVPPDARPDAPHLAWWQVFLIIAEAIWTGIEAAGKYILLILQWSVKMLWAFAIAVKNGLTIVGQALQGAGRVVWKFLRIVYEDILKPAWLQFFKFVKWAKDLLERVFTPVLKFLKVIRDDVLGFYKKWVKPILDTIELARKVLKVLETLHVDWAKTLDAELADLERRISAPFQLVLRKVNEIINAVNRVMTADGLFQRLALVKSIERDFKIIGDEYGRLHKKPISDDDAAAAARKTYPEIDPHEPGTELGLFYESGGGKYSGIIGELVPLWFEAAGISASR